MSDAKPIFNELIDHPLVETMLKETPVLMKAKHDGVKYSDLTKQQQYQYETGRRVGQAITQLERIEQASILLDSYPYVKAWRTHYGRFQYFQYHMEAYYLGVAGLVDRLLLVINELCGFDLSGKEARMTAILKKLEETQRPKLAANIKVLQTSTRAIKKMRDEVAHAERYIEKDLYHIGLLEFHLREKTMADPDGFVKLDLDDYIQHFRKEKREQLQASNSALIPLVKNIFDELYPEYLAIQRTLAQE